MGGDVAGEIRLRKRDTVHGPARGIPVQGVGGEDYADLFRGGVVAGVAAEDAVHEAVLANSHLHHRLAEAAILLALTLAFWLLALGAAVLGGAGSGGHEANVAR